MNIAITPGISETYKFICDKLGINKPKGPPPI